MTARDGGNGVSGDKIAGFDALPPLTPPPMGADLAAELERMAPVPPRRPVRDLARVAGVSVVYGAVLLLLFHMRKDLDGLPVGWVIGVALAWFAGFGALLWLAMVPRRGAVMPRWRAAGVGAVITAIVFVVGGLLFHEQGPASIVRGLDEVHRGYKCLELGLAAAMVPIILGAIALRGAAPVGSRWVAAGLGAAGGSLGGLVLRLHCHIADGWHVGIIHGGVVALSALVAAVLARRA
jgi:hypothetical protein